MSQGGTPGRWGLGAGRGAALAEIGGGWDPKAWPGRRFILGLSGSGASHTGLLHPDVTQFPPGSPAWAPQYWTSPGGRKQGRRQSAPPQPASPQEGGGGGGVEGRGPRPREEAQCWPRPLKSSVLPSSPLPGPAQNSRAVTGTCSAPPGRCSAAGSKEPRWDWPRCSDPALASAVRFETAEGGGTQGHAPSKSRPLLASPAVGSSTQSFRPAQSRSPISL